MNIDNTLLTSTSGATCIPSDPSWGIDTVKFSYPVNPDLSDLSHERWIRSTGPKSQKLASAFETLHQVVEVLGIEVRVTYYRNPDIVHVYLNAGEFVRQHPYDLLPPGALRLLVEKIIAALSPLAWPTFCSWDKKTGEMRFDHRWPDHVFLKRLDVARNFVVDEPESILQGLLGVRGKYQKEWEYKRGRNNGWTLCHKTAKNGQDRLYDKSAETPVYEDPDCLVYNGKVLRFETQLQGQRLKTEGLSTLRAITAKSAWAVACKRWEYSGWGSPVARPGTVIEATRGLDLLQQERLIGFLHLQASGEVSRMDENHLRTFGERAKKCGLQVGRPVETLGVPDRRLDLPTGSLLAVSDVLSGETAA